MHLSRHPSWHSIMSRIQRNGSEKEVEAKVITVDPEKEKLVLSAKQVAKEAAIEERNHKISMIVPGL